ncbi:protein TALPID3 [Osmerus mordax]|uniref:protein TALPID3 n=1 Tax=Osmerus mordax TaxID=8014 RepID=UPI00350F7834
MKLKTACQTWQRTTEKPGNTGFRVLCLCADLERVLYGPQAGSVDNTASDSDPKDESPIVVVSYQQAQARVVEEEERPGDDGDDGAGEDYLVKLYGKALYEGHRRTLKKGPYLRFSSPSPRSRGPRPRVVESVRGVKMKSSKTQTNLAPDRTVSFPLPPSTNQAQYIFSPTRGGLNDPMEGYLLPIAIPLGRRRVDGVAPLPSRVFISDRPIVVTTTLPPSPPRPAPAPRKPTVTLLEVKSDQRRRPLKLTVQVQPSVNIVPPASILVRSPPPRPPTPPSQIQTVEETLERRKREEEEEEKEENVFPGTNFLAVVDISQETEEDSEVLDGENRTAQSEERSDASDEVEEDTDAPVGSEIRQYINEALTEIVAQMLDQRAGQTQERPAPPTPTQEPPPPQQEDLVPTPMPTPEASISSIVASPGRSPLGTPEPSDQGSPELTPRDVQPAQPQQSTPTEPEPEPVVTPASTPTSTPLTLTPQPSLEPPSQRNHPWGDAELPLAEEQPHNSLEMNTQPSKPLVMSVAVEEPLLASPPISVPSIPLPQPARSPTPPPPPLPGPATPSSAPSSSTEDSSSSSSTVSRTDTAVKHISEGELLFSYNKLMAAQAYEEGLYLPCDIPSFSSSLHEVQDMVLGSDASHTIQLIPSHPECTDLDCDVMY